MPRPILDPLSIAGATGQQAIERLPRRVRAFGHYPDIQKLQAGDLILVAPIRPSLNAKAIQRAQRQTQSDDDAQWTHAATYLGDNSLVEIDVWGVQVNDLDKYVPTHRILFRRVLDLQNAPSNTLLGLRIAVAALKEFKTRYGFNTVFRLGQRAISGARTAYQLDPHNPEAICSDFFNDAVAKVLGRGAASAKRNPFTPADLSASTNLVDLPVGWVKLV